jgi:hypothetical protein
MGMAKPSLNSVYSVQNPLKKENRIRDDKSTIGRGKKRMSYRQMLGDGIGGIGWPIRDQI